MLFGKNPEKSNRDISNEFLTFITSRKRFRYFILKWAVWEYYRNTFNAAEQKFAIYTYFKLIDELQLTG